jgi:hypothetical protein
MIRQPAGSYASLNGRPDRSIIIQKDEILSLRIDLETMTVDQIIGKYCIGTDQKSSGKGNPDSN